jgi:transposase-like protein
MKRRWTTESDTEIVKRYEAGESAAKIAKSLGADPIFAFSALKRAGIKARAPGRPRIFNEDLATRVVEAYRNGATYADLKRDFGVTSTIVDKSLKWAGLPGREKGSYTFKTQAQRDELIARYTSGEAQSSLAMHYGVSRDAILTVLNNAGVPIRDPNDSCGFPFADVHGRLWQMRSSWEIKFAKYLDRINAWWDYELERFDVGHGMTYLPDFWIYYPGTRDLICLVDIKGFLKSKSRTRIILFRQQYPQLPLFVLQGTDLVRFGILPLVGRNCQELSYHADFDQRVVDMYAAGSSTHAIGEALDIDPTTVAKVLRQLGTNMRSGREAQALYYEQHKRICDMPECGRKHYGKGLCRRHWEEQWRATKISGPTA